MLLLLVTNGGLPVDPIHLTLVWHHTRVCKNAAPRDDSRHG